MALTKIGLKIVKDSFRTSFSGSFRGELSSSASTFVGGGISGSSISTGSFGRVEAAGVVFADSFKSVTGGTAIDFNDDISLTGNLTATGNVSGSITSTGSFGRVNSTTIDIDSIQGNWTNAGNTVADLGIITTADINGGTIDGITLGTNSAITEAQIDSVNINGSTIKDFSSVSGSSVSTGSFGRVITSTADINGGTIDGITSLTAGGDLDIGAHGFRASTLTSDSQTSGRVAIYSTAGLLSEDSDLTFSGATLSATNVTTTGTIKDFASVSGSYVSTGSVGRIQTRAADIGTITGTTLSVTGNISSSATSTGSVGRLETQQTNASLGGSIINLAGNLTTAGTLTTQNNNVTINAAGAARTLTLNESLTVGDGHDGILTYSAASKTLTVENTSVVNQDLTSDASPTFAGGTVTGNLSVGGIFTAQEVHTEFESASVLFTSGSTRFGNDTTDIHRVTGSMDISGSLKLPHGDVTITDTLTATNIGAFNLTGKLTAGSTEIEGSAFDINGGTIDGITSLTAGGDLDIGAHDLRAATITADSLTATRVPFAGTAGVLSDDADLTFATATLSATNLTTTGTIKNMALVSGSSISTGSFGSVIGVGNSNSFGNTDIDGTLTVDGGNIVFNEDSADVDFRVESDLSTHALFVQGSDNLISFGNASSAVASSHFQFATGSSAADVIVGFYNQAPGSASGRGLVLQLGQQAGADHHIADGGELANITFLGQANDAAYVGGKIAVEAEVGGDIGRSDTATTMIFSTNKAGGTGATESLRISETGKVGIGASAPGELLHILGSSDPTLKIQNSGASTVSIIAGGAAFINSSANLAFKTNGSTEAMRIDNSQNVGIGSVTQVSTGITNFAPKLEVRGGTGTLYSGAGGLILSNADTTILDGDVLGVIAFQSPLEANAGDGVLASATIRAEADDTFGSTSHKTSLLFATGNDELPSDAMRIDSNQNTSFSGFISVGGLPIDSNIGINLTSSVVGARFVTTSTNANHEAVIVNRSAADGTLIAFQSEDSDEGTIAVSGGTVSYNTFLGAHYSLLSDNSTPDIELGTVVSTIDELLSGHGDRLAKFKISDTVGDKRVYGVWSGEWNYDNDGNLKHGRVWALGAGKIKVTGACQGGDLLESNGDGTAKVQDDDIIRSKTIAKVTVGNSNTGVKVVPCVLYCG